MVRKIDPCLQCGRDTRAEAEEALGNSLSQLMCTCGRYFCIRCTENIYKFGNITECPACGRPVNVRRITESDSEDNTESEKTPD